MAPLSTNQRVQCPSSPSPESSRPLEGLRVVECGQFIASDWAGALLSYFGAEVIKIEPLGGDGIRQWRELDDSGTSLWWYSIGRNKKSVCLDLRQEKGKEVLRKLTDNADVLLENFKPGTLEDWDLSPESLRLSNPSLIVTRISGYGQTGPYSSRPGFASVCEAFGGFRYVTAVPAGEGEGEKRNPVFVRPNLSLGDTLCSLNAVLGTLLALIARGRLGKGGDAHEKGIGQTVDASIVESVMGVLESVIPEADWKAVNREPAGSTITGIVPSNVYPCREGGFIIIGANSAKLFKKLMTVIGRDDLGSDVSLENNARRVERQEEIDTAIGKWTQTKEPSEVQEIMDKTQIPCGQIYSAKQILSDEHFQSRGCFEEVPLPEGAGAPKRKAESGEGTERDKGGAHAETCTLKIPSIAPILSRTPGKTHWPGPPLGAHTKDVLLHVCGLSLKEIGDLEASQVVLVSK